MRVNPAEMLDAMHWLHAYYASAEGLARPNGLSVSGRPDFEGIAAWVLDVFLNSRLHNLAPDTCRQNVVCCAASTTIAGRSPKEQRSTERA